MFERGSNDRSGQGAVSVAITLDDGQELTGNFLIPVGRSLFEILNMDGSFIEYQSFDGEQHYIAKHALRSVKLMNVAKEESLAVRLRNKDGFDPFAILGVDQGRPWHEVRAAYLELSKHYHPDRYCNADLPEEVTAYLAAMARRINAAYAALEATKSKTAQPAPRYTRARVSA